MPLIKDKKFWQDNIKSLREECRSERAQWESVGRLADYERCWTLALDFVELMAFGPRGMATGLQMIGHYPKRRERIGHVRHWAGQAERVFEEWRRTFCMANGVSMFSTLRRAIDAAYAQAFLEHGQAHDCWTDGELRQGLVALLEYRFLRTLGLPAHPVLDDWLDLTLKGVVLVDMPDRHWNLLDLRRDGIFFTQAVPAVPPPPPTFPPHPRSAAKPLWLRNAIWGDRGLVMRFQDAVAETSWIVPGPKKLHVSQSFGQRMEWERVEHWKVGGTKVLFLDGEWIRLEGCDAATLKKLCTWAETFGACFTRAQPLEQEYWWYDDGEHEPPPDQVWDPATCTLKPKGEAVASSGTTRGRPGKSTAGKATRGSRAALPKRQPKTTTAVKRANARTKRKG